MCLQPNETYYNDSESLVHIGTDGTYFFNGTLDEVSHECLTDRL